jgi:hypothetical protein
MREKTYATEARKCRNLALRYVGRPEQTLLINVADVFEDLARKGNSDQRYCSAAGDWPRPALIGQAAPDAAAYRLNSSHRDGARQ